LGCITPPPSLEGVPLDHDEGKDKEEGGNEEDEESSRKSPLVVTNAVPGELLAAEDPQGSMARRRKRPYVSLLKRCGLGDSIPENPETLRALLVRCLEQQPLTTDEVR